MIYLELEDLLHIAGRVLPEVQLRDVGLLEAAAARPRASMLGTHAYRIIHEKAASLIHSVARDYALVDGNKRLALASGLAFYAVNGYRLTMSNDQAYDLIVTIAAGDLDDVEAIAGRLGRHVRRRQ